MEALGLNLADWFILIVLIASGIISFARGFTKEFLSLFLWLAAFIAAISLEYLATPKINEFIGNEEISNVIQSQSKYTNTILLSNNYPKIFQSKNTNCHFFDTNDIGFNLPKLNSMNIIELASLKHNYFGGSYYFYNEYPSLNIFDKATHYKKPDLTNVDIYHGNGITECIELLKTKYELSTNIPVSYTHLRAHET